MKRPSVVKQAPQSESEDYDRIETIIKLIYRELLKKDGGRFKVSELIKAIELKRKLAPRDDRDKRFWNMIDDLRTEERSPQTQSPSKKLAPQTGPLQANQTQ